jgi:PAS domain S-box-containing protein
MFSVLYVDDEPVLLETTKLYLERDGNFLVDTSTNAKNALEKINNRSYDVIVSDYQMPEMDGIRFLKELRNAGNAVPFIIFTGKGREDVVIEAYNAGADAYLQKGGEPKVMFLDLTRAIEQAVNRKRTEAELKFRNVLLATQQEVSPDGILVIGETGGILSFNNRFATMWGIPGDVLATKSDTAVLDTILEKLVDPHVFLDRVQYLYNHRQEASGDEILLRDGRTFDRYSAPMVGTAGEYYGRVWYFRDITDKKRAEEVIRKSAEQYQTLIESANEAIFIIQDGVITYSNPSGLRLIGETADQISSHSFLDVVYPEDRKEALVRHQKRLAGKAVEPGWQLRIIDKTGRTHWIELDAVRIQWNGKPATLNFATNITLRKAALQASSENETKYREIFNNANDAIEMQVLQENGLPGKYIEVNDVACRMLQYTRDELLRMSPLDLVTSTHSTPVEEIGKNLISEEHAFFTTDHRRKDGKIIPVEINAHTIILAGKKVVLSVVRDISERMKQEQAVRLSEERFKQIAENAGSWIWEVDTKGMYTYSSPVIEKILGYTPEELVGKKYFYDFFVPEEREKMKEEALAVFSRQEIFRGFVNPNLHKDGRLVYLETTGAPILNGQGEFAGYRGADTDITDRRRAEQAVRQSLDEKELLLKEIHHRVKNNLQTISSLLYLQSLTTENAEQLAVIREARARVTSMGLIHQKLYQSADIASIPFTDYVRSLIDFLRESYGVDATRVQIAVEVHPPDLTLDIDTGIPCGLLINEMITNSLKYAFPEHFRGTIRIRMVRDSRQQYTLSVSDDGIGLPADFDPETAKTLGMKIISGLVDQLDGELEITRGPGTTLSIHFPVLKTPRSRSDGVKTMIGTEE